MDSRNKVDGSFWWKKFKDIFAIFNVSFILTQQINFVLKLFFRLNFTFYITLHEQTWLRTLSARTFILIALPKSMSGLSCQILIYLCNQFW